ncbi:RNA recognition motif domain-containing protein [Ditylenchus destructor]|nr:RNA recognition motif domain-containing protein [Ditylenchus destructor]
MLSLFRSSRIYSNQLSNNRRQLCVFTSIFSIPSNVNHEETRKLSICASLSHKYHSIPLKKLFNTNVNRISQIYALQSFSSNSGSGKFDKSRYSERDSRTVMVASLSKDTTDDSLRQYFSKKWEVTNCEIIRDKKTGISRQFGFVEFATVEQAELASKDCPFIDSKNVSVQMKAGKEFQEKYRIFVGGLPKQITQATLHRYFSQFGDIFECSIVRNDDNLSKGFGYVVYKSQKSLDRALRDQPHEIDGVEVRLDYSTHELDLSVNSLPHNISQESLKELLWDFFSDYGRVRNCEFIKNSAGTTTAFVAMSGKDEISRALNGRPHWIGGKLVDTRHQGAEFALIVHGLPKDATDEDLYKTFSKAGKLVHWQVMRAWKDKTNRPLGYGYVKFSTAEDVARAIENQPYEINGTMLKIERRYDIYKEEK